MTVQVKKTNKEHEMLTQIPQKDIIDITYRLKAISFIVNKLIPVSEDNINFDEEGRLFISENLYEIINQLERYEICLQTQ
jgi:hypothetical protein